MLRVRLRRLGECYLVTNGLVVLSRKERIGTIERKDICELCDIALFLFAGDDLARYAPLGKSRALSRV